MPEQQRQEIAAAARRAMRAARQQAGFHGELPADVLGQVAHLLTAHDQTIRQQSA